MPQLYNKRTGELLGEITESELQFLKDQLEEESMTDKDYAITGMTIDYFMTQGADPGLVLLLRQALGERDEIVVEWR